MAFAWLLSALAQAFGMALGLRALIDPHWAARFVRLKPDEQEGGFAEFRAIYGGVFAALHAAALLVTMLYLLAGGYLVGVVATGAIGVLAAGWGGAAVGRALSMWRDGVRTRFNMICAGVEAGMALALALPWIVWFFAKA